MSFEETKDQKPKIILAEGEQGQFSLDIKDLEEIEEIEEDKGNLATPISKEEDEIENKTEETRNIEEKMIEEVPEKIKKENTIIAIQNKKQKKESLTEIKEVVESIGKVEDSEPLIDISDELELESKNLEKSEINSKESENSQTPKISLKSNKQSSNKDKNLISISITPAESKSETKTINPILTLPIEVIETQGEVLSLIHI